MRGDHRKARLTNSLTYPDLASLDPQEQHCSICFGPFATPVQPGSQSPTPSSPSAETPVQLPCGHVFGLDCIQNWLLDSKNTSCPQCRQVVLIFFPHEMPFPELISWAERRASFIEYLWHDERVRGTDDAGKVLGLLLGYTTDDEEPSEFMWLLCDLVAPIPGRISSGELERWLLELDVWYRATFYQGMGVIDAGQRVYLEEFLEMKRWAFEALLS